ncbi:MAG: sigma-70 family RNA polymerase sigma factor [Acidobacteria bacterium]|nr:MAG: sigma-70 family RNA polymerase sigma factor [Acidobacteriota bacterium]
MPSRSAPRRWRTRRLLDVYLEEARRVTDGARREETRERGGRPRAGKIAPERVRELVEPHLFFVVQMAGEYRSRDIPFEDVLAEGNAGLVEAAHHYDPSHNVKFLTYASWWIRKRILDLLGREGKAVRLTRYARDRRRQVRQALDGLRAELGREPTSEEIADALGLPAEKVREESGGVVVMSIDGASQASDGIPMQERLPDRLAHTPEEALLREQTRRQVLKEVARLPQRERIVILNRFGLDGTEARTFEELGRILGVSRERARQLEAEALRKLRRRLQRRFSGSRPSRPGSRPAP